MKGHKTGLADWEQIRIVNLQIPVIANGNILYTEDIDRCIEATGVDGVMTAEVWKLAEEYLDICKENPNSANIGMIRGHLFKIFAPCLADVPDLRTSLASLRSLDDFFKLTAEIKERLLKANGGQLEFNGEYDIDEKGIKILPNWVAQPHLRPEYVAPQKQEKDTETASDETGAPENSKANGSKRPLDESKVPTRAKGESIHFLILVLTRKKFREFPNSLYARTAQMWVQSNVTINVAKIVANPTLLIIACNVNSMVAQGQRKTRIN
ncbi:tRNA-dihydrouridine(16/17) synthase [NAD(P)(+)]-like protein [Phlyctochytrium planicorne]|nr:tRNA-dihydrouridine(16/17) synthase [NAD(P)(+)]-like protein [Phlyctochytrium planicorne]